MLAVDVEEGEGDYLYVCGLFMMCLLLYDSLQLPAQPWYSRAVKKTGQYMILTFSSSWYLSAVVWWKGRGGTSDSSCSTWQLEPCFKGSVVIISIPDDIAHLQSPCSFPACAVCTFWQNKKDQQDIIQRRNILAHVCWQISVVFVLHQSTTITKLWHSGFLKIC